MQYLILSLLKKYILTAYEMRKWGTLAIREVAFKSTNEGKEK